ncbi:DUF4266 domain-containing protein [Teredinibacter turnerae]|uniref:DUF4266 domain-containing protein n=1 Tax=Teredinibacter turnerae TaxID=2426 RepID=UPI0005F7B7BE|nr:DUF4266 domain-containing protein [Teredinibacter turnerae]
MIIRFIVAVLVASAATGCTQVKVWERGNLARNEMAFTPDPLEQKIQDHIYHSKEASQSVAAGAGGGCGCN